MSAIVWAQCSECGAISRRETGWIWSGQMKERVRLRNLRSECCGAALMRARRPRGYVSVQVQPQHIPRLGQLIAEAQEDGELPPVVATRRPYGEADVLEGEGERSRLDALEARVAALEDRKMNTSHRDETSVD